MYRNAVQVVLAACLFALFFVFPQTARTDSSSIHLTSNHKNGIEFSVLTTDALVRNGQVTIEGVAGSVLQEGAPSLPKMTTLVALPPNTDVTVALLNADTTTLNNVAVSPVPSVKLPADQAAFLSVGGVEELGLELVQDQAIYSAETHYPNSWFEVSEPMHSRDLRFVRITVYPTRYNPVSKQLLQATSLAFAVDFNGADSAKFAGTTIEGEQQKALLDQMINGHLAANWGGMPAHDADRAVTVTLPVNKQSLKIEISENGIYQLTRSDLIAAGMNVNTINPNTLEMMHRGHPVATKFLGDGDNSFEANEKLYFYGWAFDGPRHESQYVVNNVFWLWSGGTPTTVPTVSNASGQTQLEQYRASVTVEPEKAFNMSYTNNWDSFPNEPDTWYWQYLKQPTAGTPVDFDFNVPLTAPSSSGSDAQYTVEYITFFANFHNIHLDVNGVRRETDVSVPKLTNTNLIGNQPQNLLLDGVNTFKITLDTPAVSNMLLNRITVDYWRDFVAENDYIEYEIDSSNGHEVVVQEMSSASGLVAWDISDRNNPVEVSVGVFDRSGSGPFNYRVGRDVSSTKMAVTNEAMLKSPVRLSNYTAPSIEPATGADWIAITHSDFAAAAQVLAQHRENNSNLSTFVVDVEDVINQAGFGLPIPQLIADYVGEGVATWSTAPSYVVLIGDATVAPKLNPCTDSVFCIIPGSNPPVLYDTTADQVFVPTFLDFSDRFHGLAPSDHEYAMVVGNDIVPDLSVGRLSAKTAAEAQTMVDKIILYEANLSSTDAWANDVWFVSDNTDSGGNFCAENANSADLLPAEFDVTEQCVATSAAADETAVGDALLAKINSTSMTLLNYRGHGGISKWGSSRLLKTADVANMTNVNRPFVVLSADCLDGHHAWMKQEGMSETLVGASNGGAAAHWGSTGLGFTFEHSILHSAYLEAVYSDDVVRIGDAINIAKTIYIGYGQDKSETFAFTLQGDPAMNQIDPASVPTAVGLDSSAVQQPALVAPILLIVAVGLTMVVVRRRKSAEIR